MVSVATNSLIYFALFVMIICRLLRWVNQYEELLAHYGVRSLSPSVASITADTIRKFAADSETHMRTMLKRILKNARVDTPAASGAETSPLPAAPAVSTIVSAQTDNSQLCRSSVPRDLFAMLWEQIRCCESTGNGQLLLSTVQVAVRVVNRWTAAESSQLSTERPVKAVCSVANNMEACMQHASELIEHVQAVLAKTNLLVSSNGRTSSLGALEATFDDAYRVALHTLRDMVLADISPLLREAQTMNKWSASDGMDAVLATTEDFFNDFEPKLLAAPYRAMSVDVLDALLADYVKALLLGFRHNAAIVKANAALEVRQQEDPLSSLVGQAPMPLDPNWKESLLEQFQQDLTSVKTFFRELVSDAAMQNSVGAVESLPVQLSSLEFAVPCPVRRSQCPLKYLTLHGCRCCWSVRLSTLQRLYTKLPNVLLSFLQSSSSRSSMPGTRYAISDLRF